MLYTRVAHTKRDRFHLAPWFQNVIAFPKSGLWSRQVISALTSIVLCPRWWTRPSKVFKYWQLGKYFPPPCTRRPTRVQLFTHVQRWRANCWLKWDIVTSNICGWRSLDSNNSNVKSSHTRRLPALLYYHEDGAIGRNDHVDMEIVHLLTQQSIFRREEFVLLIWNARHCTGISEVFDVGVYRLHWHSKTVENLRGYSQDLERINLMSCCSWNLHGRHV